MFIARVLADAADLETRLEAMTHGLRYSDVGLPEPEARWLDIDSPVLELRFEDIEPQMSANIVAQHFGGLDCLMSTSDIVMPQLFVSDMDSTMIAQECIDELADYAGIKPQIAAITERAMQGEIDFETSLRERIALLEGLEESTLEQCLRERIHGNRGAAELVMALKSKGVRTVLVTGGFHHFADRVAQDFGFDRVVGNRLEVSGGKLTGRLEGAISDAETKARVLREEAAKLGQGAVTLAIGDGANDIPMIEAATFGFAYRAKPAARDAANGRIESDDLCNVLSLLGINRNGF